jgi:membrane protease YdiL (CAAX protease family)
VRTVPSSVRRHPVLTFYALAFALSWGAMLLAIGGPSGIPGTPEEVAALIPIAIPALLAGPSVAGIVMTGLIHGRAGLRKLLSRLLRWRAGARWYAVALLTAPLAMAVIPLALSVLSPEFVPGVVATGDKASLLALGILAGLLAGIFEELGWTGFATPELRLRYAVLPTGILMGLLWGGWHFLVNFWSSGTPSGALSQALLLHSLLFSVGILPAYRVLMVWVYDRTGSLPMAMLMHASLTASNVILVPLATGVVGPAWSLVVAAALWAIVAMVVVANRGRLSLTPLPRPAG